MKRKSLSHIVLLSLFSLAFVSCAIDKYVPDSHYYLKSVKVDTYDESFAKAYDLNGYIKQGPNTKWFGLKIPMRIYCISKPNSNGFMSRTLRKIGETPVLLDTAKVSATITDLRRVMSNGGYLHHQIDTLMTVNGKSVDLTYELFPGERYTISEVSRNVEDSLLTDFICIEDTANSLLRKGIPLDVNTLNEERKRLTKVLRNRGYYKFHKDYITFVADTITGSTSAHLTMNLSLHREDGRSEPIAHPQYTISDITYYVDCNSPNGVLDSLYDADGNKILYMDKLRYRPGLLTNNTLFKTGELYNDELNAMTYNSFIRLGAISNSNIRFTPNANHDSLSCDIILSHAMPQSVSLDLEGTNTAGDLGAAVSTSYQHRNLFKGSESLTFKIRGAYEAITGLEGYDGDSYKELGGEVRLGFPGFLLPYIDRRFAAIHRATSEIALQYNYQDRPEFNRRVLTGAWRYRWQSLSQRFLHRFDLLEVNYINMPWISSKFKEEYLDAIGKQNSILRYNYENILITKLGYNFTYNSLGSSMTSTYGKDAFVIRGNIETSGNLLNGYTSIFGGNKDSQGHRTFLDIAYAQYVRGDLDLSRSIVIDRNNSFAMHLGFGIAIPYGNSSVLPFEKRYFSGGANSVRGWSVRSLGPGGYRSDDNHINFINQSGDIKLDLSLEWRTHLFWKMNGALFIDGGNIWTIRKYDDQPKGEFRFDKFYKQIAFSYGLGLRMTLDFFTLRFDAGMKAIDPAYNGSDHYPIFHPDLSRDFSFHFAVGLPF